MPIHAAKNLYRGVNPHLNSLLQNRDGEWQSFHATHIADMRRMIEVQLPPNYYARSEKTLQTTDMLLMEHPQRTRPDVSIFAVGESPSLLTAPSTPTAAVTLTLSIRETMEIDEEDWPTAVVIYVAEEDGTAYPCTRIELLSPANKPPNSGHKLYQTKRLDTLRAGIRLIELDYLHQSRPPLVALPRYATHDPGSFAYSILVTDPRPTFDEGITYVYSFGVDEPFPSVNIPLAGKEMLTFDFGTVYHFTYESLRFHRFAVDYTQRPLHFETYSPADQQRILARMDAIAQTHVGSET